MSKSEAGTEPAQSVIDFELYERELQATTAQVVAPADLSSNTRRIWTKLIAPVLFKCFILISNDPV